MAAQYKSFSIALDLKRAVTNRDAVVVQGDTGNRFIITLTDEGVAFDLSSCRVAAQFSNTNGTAQQISWGDAPTIVISGTSHNIITLDLQSGSFANGNNLCEIQVYSGATYTTLVTSAQFAFMGRNAILNNTTILSTTQYPALVALQEQYATVLAREQSNYDETDDTEPTFIRNKPVVGTDVQDATQNLTAEATLSDADTIPFYDASATAHRKSTWANIVAKIKTAFFGSVTGIAKLDGAGNITAAAANTDFAAATHASRHAVGAADATTKRFSISVSATWSGTSAPYTQTISVSGVTSDMVGKPFLVYSDSDSLATKLLQKEAFALVSDVDTGSGSVTLSCYEDKPSTAFNMVLEVAL